MALPTDQVSIVIIGGGVMGCSLLYHLASLANSDSLLIERNKVTSGTTWHSAAQVRALRSTRNLTDLIRYSIELYGRLEQETGQATGWINKGSLSIATTPARLIHVQRQAALAGLFGLRAETISRDEAKERWPLMHAEDVLGAVWSPDDGRVSPSDLCAALVKGATARGAKICEDTAVTGILTKAGRVVGVETSAGTVRCDAVAICAGLWSREVAAMAGAAVPVWPCEHFYLLTKPIDGITGNVPTLSDHDHHLYIRDDSGGLLVGCFEPMGKAIDPARLGPDFAFQLLEEDWDHFEPMMMNALHRLPALANAEVKSLLNGPEGFTPDGSFLLGETAETRGLFLGCGMNSVGVATGGGAGMALAHMIVHGRPPHDLHEADPKRFPDCFNSAAALSARVPEVLGRHYEITFPGRQMATARKLRSGPLDAKWAGAYRGQVAGYERPLYMEREMVLGGAVPALTFGRPVWFEQVGREVAAVLEGAVLFDLSSFGKLEVRGPDAVTFLNRVCANQMNRPAGRTIYTAMLNDRGGIESDLTVQRLGQLLFRLFVGTTAVRRDLAWLRRHADAFDVTITDVTDDFAVIGLMGAGAPTVARAVRATAMREAGYFRCVADVIAGEPVIAARLSYVGEMGWEITCSAGGAGRVFDALHAAGAVPVGLYAQTSMRIEKRFLAYGHDLDTDISPLQAGLGFAVDWDTDFIGREALEQQRGEPSRIRSLVLDDPAAEPIGGEPVLLDGAYVGRTTSAAFGYRVGRPVAIADLTQPAARIPDAKVQVDIAGDLFDARVVDGPAYDPAGHRLRPPTA